MRSAVAALAIVLLSACSVSAIRGNAWATGTVTVSSSTCNVQFLTFADRTTYLQEITLGSSSSNLDNSCMYTPDDGVTEPTGCFTTSSACITSGSCSCSSFSIRTVSASLCYLTSASTTFYFMNSAKSSGSVVMAQTLTANAGATGCSVAKAFCNTNQNSCTNCVAAGCGYCYFILGLGKACYPPTTICIGDYVPPFSSSNGTTPCAGATVAPSVALAAAAIAVAAYLLKH